MRVFLPYLLLLCCGALPASAQHFEFEYTTIGMGSGRGMIQRHWVAIENTMLINSHYLWDQPCAKGQYGVVQPELWATCFTHDTLHFPPLAIKELKQALKPYKGQSLYNANTHIMSGEIEEFEFVCDDWCAEFTMHNTRDSVLLPILAIINRYLPEDDRFWIWDDPRGYSDNDPLIRECGTTHERNSRDVYGSDYDLIRQNATKKKE